MCPCLTSGPRAPTPQVFIHNFNGTQWDRDYNRSMQLAVLTVNQTYRSPFVDQG